VERATTLAYCQELDLPRVEDPSNQSRAYTRNRVRLELLPALEAFNPAIRSVLARLADLAAEDERALESTADALQAELARGAGPDSVSYDLQAWRRQPRGIQRRLLRRALHQLLGQLVDVPAAPIDDALDLLASSHGRQAYHLPGGVELEATGTQVVLRLHGRAQPPHQPKSWGNNPPRV
jgi:tRNA(Ile)-lysidine synthase